MTENEFAQAVRLLCQQFGGSVTSWGRTHTRSQAVGGFVGDPHTHWFGADIVWDSSIGLDAASPMGRIAERLGLQVHREVAHDHLQPLDYPSGPLSDEQVEAWKAGSK